jgi:hypothetical protein
LGAETAWENKSGNIIVEDFHHLITIFKREFTCKRKRFCVKRKQNPELLQAQSIYI